MTLSSGARIGTLPGMQPSETYLLPPRVMGPPEPSHACATRRFQGIPTIERTSHGRLWAAWYGGGVTEDRFNHVLLATSSDGGEGWTPPILVIDPDGEGPVRAFDPCLWHDPSGKLWLFWAQGFAGHKESPRSGVWAVTTTQSDQADPVWSAPVRLCDGIMMNKPTVLSTGEWLLPVAHWHREGSAGVVASADKGRTWTWRGWATVPKPADRNCDEHMFVERRNGTLWMLVRTKYGIGECVSTDGGRTWPDVVPSELAHTASRFYVRRQRSGRLLLVKHGKPGEATGRSHLMAFLSEDDGRTWVGGLLLDARSGVSYPDGVEDDRGMQWVIYDYDRRGAKEIRLARFSEDDVLRGGEARTVLVNKASGEPVTGK
jgi:predicted neuraminidase